MMVIFTNWGEDVKIICGSIDDEITVIRENDGQIMTRHLNELKADGGFQEILDALIAANEKKNEILKYTHCNRGNKEARQMTDKQIKEVSK